MNRLTTVTNNIYLSVAGINFISAGINFPRIADLNIAGGVGNVLIAGHLQDSRANPNLYPGGFYNINEEINDIFHRCRVAWEAQGGWTGLIAVNVGSYNQGEALLACYVDPHHGIPPRCFAAGDFSSYTLSNVIGLSGCETQFRSIWTSSCHDGYASVSDDSTLPDSTNQVTLGHELGHALGLGHRSSSVALMNPIMVPNPLTGIYRNIGLNNDEVNHARGTAYHVNDVIIDPASKIASGPILEASKLDDIHENKSIPSYLDLSAVKVASNATDNTVSFGQEISGLLSLNKTRNVQYWTLVDTDGNSRGAGQDLLNTIGVPATKFKGADLIFKAEPIKITRQETKMDNESFFSQNVTLNSSAWKFQNGKLLELPSKGLVTTLILFPSLRPEHLIMPLGHVPTSPLAPHIPSPPPMQVHQTFYVVIPSVNFNVSKPFRIQAITTIPSVHQVAVDSLGNSTATEENGTRLVLKNTSYPMISLSQGNSATAGNTIPIKVQGLTPQSKITAFFADQPMLNGLTQSNGSTSIQFPIPNNATKGLHTIRVVVDGTALTAVSEVNVIASHFDCTRIPRPSGCTP